MTLWGRECLGLLRGQRGDEGRSGGDEGFSLKDEKDFKGEKWVGHSKLSPKCLIGGRGACREDPPLELPSQVPRDSYHA